MITTPDRSGAGASDGRPGPGTGDSRKARRAETRGELAVVEWFRVGEHERVERVLDSLRAMGVTRIRTGIARAHGHADGGEAWYGWLLPTLARELEVLPCFLPAIPPSVGGVFEASPPLRRPRELADLLDVVLDRAGAHFEWVELRCEPDAPVFARVIADGARSARMRGKRTVLGGMSAVDPARLAQAWDRGLVEHVEAVGIHGFPGTWERSWPGWEHAVEQVRRVWKDRRTDPELWITEAGYSTASYDEVGQARRFLNALDADVERVYWYAAEDLAQWYAVEDLAQGPSTVEGAHTDERRFHFGLRRVDGSPKLLARLLEEGGVPAVRDLVRRAAPARGARARTAGDLAAPEGRTSPGPRTLIIGGCGFIGANLADRLLEAGAQVHILDDLSRPGSERNLRRLQTRHRGLAVTVGDIRDPRLVSRAVERAGRIFHLATRAAVTAGRETPMQDFEVNVRGTLNVLCAAEARDDPPALLFASTSKIYGRMDEIELRAMEKRYEPTSDETWAHGIPETSPLRWQSPFGCSKGAADQYVLAFARSFGLPAVVFRLSSVYGPRQFGNEDRGWITHFVRQALEGRTVTLFGDGKQVRDILYVSDLVDVLLRAMERIDEVRGEAFNVGGGPERAVSLLELLDVLESLGIPRPQIHFADARPGDQRYYVTDLRKVERALDWSPGVSVQEGLRRLFAVLEPNEPSPDRTGPRQGGIALAGEGAGRDGSPDESENRP
jgi:CDP-paratose 2-epimerase